MSDPEKAELERLRQGRVFVAGHNGMVGSAIVRRLTRAGCENLITCNRSELDLGNQSQVQQFFGDHKPNYVFLAAATVGGIKANDTYPADFIYDNLMIAANTIHAAYENKAQRVLFLGSSCIYPRLAPQPMAENTLLTGPLEQTNEPYAVAKIAGIKLCESYNRQHGTDFRSVMPTNLYGPNDNFDLETSHVLPAMIHKFHDAAVNSRDCVEIWGTGNPRREFLHVDDLADGCLFVMCLSQSAYRASTEPRLSHLNIGTGNDVTIRELAEIVREAVGFKGDISYNPDLPDGTPRKLLNVSKLTALGWRAHITLSAGVRSTYDWYRRNASQGST